MALVWNEEKQDFVENKYTWIDDLIATLIVIVLSSILVSLFGRLMLYIIGQDVHGFFYNLIFGAGIITVITFLCAACEEFKDRS